LFPRIISFFSVENSTPFFRDALFLFRKSCTGNIPPSLCQKRNITAKGLNLFSPIPLVFHFISAGRAQWIFTCFKEVYDAYEGSAPGVPCPNDDTMKCAPRKKIHDLGK
jgi:hypothetical protein